MAYTQDGIVLLAKKAGITSFKSLNTIKKALDTKKVGHTGTLDSFAQGLLVVCTGKLTKLASNIIEFDKQYQAVIKFGEETDTLEYTGKVVNSTRLPDLETLKSAIKKFTGNIMQKPPAFSSIHINGERASNLARQGQICEIPNRPVTVYKADIIDVKLNSENLVEYALIDFTVSKGTYIRSLARDIGKSCSSSAHLIGLYRTRVGNFKIEDSAGFEKLEDFTINSAIKTAKEELKKIQTISPFENKKVKEKFIPDQEELSLQEEVRQKMLNFSDTMAQNCSFEIIHLLNQNAALDFCNGKNLRSKLFDTNLHSLKENSLIAVFTNDDIFTGLIEKDTTGRIHYKFVIN